MGEPLPRPRPDEPKVAWRAWARSVLKTQSARGLEGASAAIGGHLGGMLAAIGTSAPQDVLLSYIPIRGEVDPILGVSAAIVAGWRLGVGRGISATAPLQPVTVGPGLIRDGRWDTSAADPDAWAKYVAGDEKAGGSLIGRVMKASKGKADGKIVTAIMQQKRGS